ncbi:hypothetical protein L915_00749 [Phytophthora nicotianae]|uniref:RNase H type-1 domain-containing protein n=1 Tax=Phytophthora nicotianae TaxID=4792 RepID=W2HMR6_PHYNI|nr:hypothetical protein L915_00749 [Phytophthora nicotianae]
MVSVLGADAINTEKFTNWSTRQRVLGLEFDSEAGQVALPEPNIQKARRIVGCAYNAKSLSRKEYRSLLERQLILEFNRGVRNGFDINYRELLSCAFAVHAWGTRWSQQSLSHSRPLHVHFRIDNASAVAWQNKLASRNPRAQVIIRLLSWWETSFRLRFSASHIAGINNVRADAGSRSPADPSFAALFASLNAGWLQVSPQVDVQGLTNIWQRISEHTPLPTPPSINTGVHYPSGKPGLRGEVFLLG